MATFFVALVGGIIGLAGGFVAGLLAGMAIAAVTNMSTFEGAAGYFAVFFCGPIGALAGLVLGVWLALLTRGRKSIGAVVTYSVSSLATIVAGSAAVIALMLFFDTTLNRGASKPQALFEIRLPPGKKLDDSRKGIEVELNTERNTASAYFDKEWHSD